MVGRHSDKSSGGVKTRHSTGTGLGGNSGRAGVSRLRSKSTSTPNASSATAAPAASPAGGAGSGRRKRYSGSSRKLDSPDSECNAELEGITSVPSSPGMTTTVTAIGGGGRTRSSNSNRLAKTTAAAPPVVVAKPISPNPSESSTCKTVCNSPDPGGEASTSHLDGILQLENQHLKDLLVSQLDLIQQQSETILSREKQLKDLRMENEHLRQRLERMERRVRGTDSSLDTPSPSLQPSADVGEPLLQNASSKEPSTQSRKRPYPGPEGPGGQDQYQPGMVPCKRIKRESGGTYSIALCGRSLEPSVPTTMLPLTLPTTSLALSSSVQSAELANSAGDSGLVGAALSQLSANRRISTASPHSTTDDSHSTELQCFDELTDEILEESDARFRIGDGGDSASSCDSGSITSEKGLVPSKKASKLLTVKTETQDESKGKMRKGPRKSVNSESKEEDKNTSNPSSSGPLEPMLTTYHYYVGCTNDLVNKDDKLTECAALQLGVEVPKYRQDPEYDKKMSRIKSNNKRNPFSKYQSEIEQLDDAAFLKRHEKPEQLEKRTKKWDIQRMREKSYCEKLRARYDASASKSKKQQPDTLLPTPECAERIQVSVDGKLPVTVFGQSVPNFMQSTFNLPWLGKKPSKAETSKRPRQSIPSSSKVSKT
eukprot:TRINITY_DN11014_c0_g1_i1.p1 TRINITY_DN11014_c0_g1~~TRINITY_DN11014_c0_g1_i1.p1  ORF type:complete len:656 (+),score=145.05 TRINITY_DN11014_c0_g1_i1:95-2062(+)